MSKERPYEFVPMYALALLINTYTEYVRGGFKALKKDLDKMQEEWNMRVEESKIDDRQITIEEYMRSRSKGE